VFRGFYCFLVKTVQHFTPARSLYLFSSFVVLAREH
jgi:hypothetical protein